MCFILYVGPIFPLNSDEDNFWSVSGCTCRRAPCQGGGLALPPGAAWAGLLPQLKWASDPKSTGGLSTKSEQKQITKYYTKIEKCCKCWLQDAAGISLTAVLMWNSEWNFKWIKPWFRRWEIWKRVLALSPSSVWLWESNLSNTVI